MKRRVSDDTEILNWDMPDEEPANIVEYMKQLHNQILSAVEREQQRLSDPDWELVDYCILPQSAAKIMLSDDTPPEIKNRLFLMSYSGQYWRRKDEKTTQTS